jgi:hypothetical protein
MRKDSALPKCAHNSGGNMALPGSQKLSKAKIRHFGIPLRVNKNITGLDVPVHYLWLQCLMQIRQTAMAQTPPQLVPPNHS